MKLTLTLIIASTMLTGCRGMFYRNSTPWLKPTTHYEWLWATSKKVPTP